MRCAVHWAGDSTVKTNNITSYPQTGIGQVMALYFHQDVAIINHAENGRSSKSFIDEHRLATIYNDLRPGDYLFIQFGHNDSKQEDLSRYTEAFGEFQLNLEKFIHVAWNRQAYPVLISPVCRRWFTSDGVLEADIHGDYPDAMAEVAERMDVPIINLYKTSRKLIESMGPQASKDYFISSDKTHLVYPGAVAFGGLIAKELQALGGVYSKLLI